MNLNGAYSLLMTPECVEPPMGRRKARNECPCANCANHIICTRWICNNCWKGLPKMYKRALKKAYDKAKFCEREGFKSALPSIARRYYKVAARSVKHTYDVRT